MTYEQVGRQPYLEEEESDISSKILADVHLARGGNSTSYKSHDMSGFGRTASSVEFFLYAQGQDK